MGCVDVDGELMVGSGEVTVVVVVAGEVGTGSTRLASWLNGLLPAADGSDGMDGMDAIVGMVGVAGAAKSDGTASSADCVVVGVEEEVAGGLVGCDDCPLTVGAASCA